MSEPRGNYVFLSFAPEDATLAMQLAGALTSRGLSVDMTRETGGGPSPTLPGAVWVVALWSKAAVGNSRMLAEIEPAFAAGRLVSVLTQEGVQVPRPFSNSLTVDLASWDGSERDKRFGRLATILGVRQAPETEVVAAELPDQVRSQPTMPLRKGTRELLELALAVADQRRSRTVEDVDVLLALMVRPAQTKLDRKELVTGATQRMLEAVPAPSSERVVRAGRALRVDLSGVLTPVASHDQNPRFRDVLVRAERIAVAVGAREIYSHHLAAAALGPGSEGRPPVAPTVLSELGVDVKALRAALRVGVAHRWPDEYAHSWNELLAPEPSAPLDPAVFAIRHQASNEVLGVATMIGRTRAVTALTVVDSPSELVIDSGEQEAPNAFELLVTHRIGDVGFAVLKVKGRPLPELDVLSLESSDVRPGTRVDVYLPSGPRRYEVIGATVLVRNDKQLTLQLLDPPGAAVLAGAPVVHERRLAGIVYSSDEQTVLAISSGEVGSKIAADGLPPEAEIEADDPDDSADTSTPDVPSPVEARHIEVGSIQGAGNDTIGDVDQLGFEQYVEAFATLITSPHSKPPLTIGIYGSWGMGKSFLLEHIRRAVAERTKMRGAGSPEEPQVYVVSFNAWAFSSSPVVWPGLVREIVSKLDKQVRWPHRKRLWTRLKRNVPRSLHHYSAHFAVAALVGVGLLLAIVFTDEKRLAATIAGLLGLVGAAGLVKAGYTPVARWLTGLFADSDYGQQLGLMDDIRHDLESLEGRLHVDGDPLGPTVGRILVVIDDLDRCEPEKAVEVLQAVNLLLNFPSFIVVLGIDARIITAAVTKHYEGLLGEAGASGYEYLDKIVQIPFRIPTPSPEEVKDFLQLQLGVVVDDQHDTTSSEDASHAPGPEVTAPAAAPIAEPDVPAPPATATGKLDPAAASATQETFLEPQASEDEGEAKEEAMPETATVTVPPAASPAEVAFTKAELDAFQELSAFLRPNPRRPQAHRQRLPARPCPRRRPRRTHSSRQPCSHHPMAGDVEPMALHLAKDAREVRRAGCPQRADGVRPAPPPVRGGEALIRRRAPKASRR